MQKNICMAKKKKSTRKKRKQPARKSEPGKQFKAPEIELSTKNILIGSFLFLLLALAYFALFPIDLQMSVEYDALSLNRTCPLQLQPGEEYVYHYPGAVEITYKTGEWTQTCLPVRGTEKQQDILIEACITREGKAIYGKLTGADGSANLSGVDFFQEWMLALKDGWTWREDAVFTSKTIGSSQTKRVEYSASSREFRGRSAFEVRVNVSSGSGKKFTPQQSYTFWVDAEKRVLLKADFGEDGIMLQKAPFNFTHVP